MKFRAILNDENSMKEFFNIILTMSKITKDIIINILHNKLIIIGVENAARSIPFTWCSIEKSTYFSEYAMVGVTNESNQIYLSVNTIKLANALTQLKNTTIMIKMKLTIKQFPCLTIQITIPLINSQQNREIIHDVPVIVIPIRDWDEYKIPQLPKFDNTITLPTLRSVRNIIDRIKMFSPILTIYENVCGELSFVIETDSATVTTIYRKLYVQQNTMDTDSEFMDSEKTEISCKISSKILSTFLSSNQFANVLMHCNIVQDHLINITVNIRDNVSLYCCILAISE